MRKIALTQRLIKNDTYFEIRESLDINWGKLIDKIGFEAFILPIEYDFNKISFNGLILTGGNDLGSISGNEIDIKRDKFEERLILHCLNNNIPMFGVCRGMQIINKYFNGTLKKVKNHSGIKHFLDNGKEVNSYHNFAVDNIGEGLKIESKSDDGIIESFRHVKYKIYAQMSHPERNEPFNNDEINFIKDFFYD